jgi:hypothetical protein
MCMLADLSLIKDYEMRESVKVTKSVSHPIKFIRNKFSSRKYSFIVKIKIWKNACANLCKISITAALVYTN